MLKWNKVVKNGIGKMCERHPVKNWKVKGCPQILLGPFLNTQPQI